MNVEVWLKIKGRKQYRQWACGPVVASKSKPDTSDDEIAIKLTLEVPDEYFEKPMFEAKLTLPKHAKNLPDLTEVAKTIGSELSKQTGFKIKISVPEELPDDKKGN